MNNRQQAAQRTRQKLLEAGKTLISERGLSGISVEDITAACGVAKGTFYTYFKSKEEIVSFLSADMFGEVLEGAKGYPGNFFLKLVHYMVSFSDWIERGGAPMAQEWVRSVTDPARTDDAKLRSDLRDMEELFSFGVRQGLLRGETPVPELAHALVEVLYGQLLCWCMQGGGFSLRGRTAAFCNEVLPAVLKKYVL